MSAATQPKGHVNGGHPSDQHPHQHRFHPLPVIGHPHAWYEKHIKQADQLGDVHARASHKVGLYITDALDPKLSWSDKLRHFKHVLEKHCTAPAGADESLQTFYHKLADLVRRYASQEAIRLVRHQHEKYMNRLRQGGATREAIADEADTFFPEFIGHDHDCPAWFTPPAWEQMRQIEAQWI